MNKHYITASFILLNTFNVCLATDQFEDDEALDRAIALSLSEHPASHDPIDQDYSLALQLQEEEDASHGAAAQRNHQMTAKIDDDFLLALQLQEEESASHSSAAQEILQIQAKQEEKRRSIPTHLLQQLGQLKATYNELITKNQVAAELLDVHVFNKEFVIPNRQVILDLTSHLGLKQDIAPQQIIDTMRGWKMKEGFSDFDKAAVILLGYLNETTSDEETGLNVAAMLSTAYSLCQQLEQHKFHLSINSPAMTAKTYMVYLINENIAEKGGCFPGFAGRLFAANVRFLCSLLGVE